MKKFNPDKELSKIRKGNKNKILYSVITLLLIVAVGSTYALYQIRHTNKLVFNMVGEFKKRDIYLSVLVDGETKSEFPGKDDGYVFDNIQCDKPGIEASFNSETWKLTLTTGTTNKCTVKFITKPYMDESGANYPDLFQGLIPIRYDNNKIYIANYKEKWYDYNNNEWANAVLIDHTNEDVMKKFYTDGKLNVNTEITTDDILQMYVWIPRYKYELFNVENKGINPQEIQIQFESDTLTTGEVSCTIASNGKETCINDENGKWYTHPAFTFGDTQLRGIWVGKFESSGNNTNIRIIPGVTPIVSQNISYMFNASRNIEEIYAANYNINKEEIDTHMMKNIEWGAMAYLTHSKYGRCDGQGTCTEVTRNAQVYKTGYDDKSNFWYTSAGQLASTTGNTYGIYDTNGGTWEYVMGNMVNADGTFYSDNAEFSIAPESKYYDKYEYDASSYTTQQRGHLGDATRETLKTFGNGNGGWYGDYARFPYTAHSWFERGGRVGDIDAAGTFAYYDFNSGGPVGDRSFRSVLSAA